MRAMQLHRSLGFWLGLPAASFLLWLWVDSLGHMNSWWRSPGITPRHTTWVSIMESELLLTRKEITGDEQPAYEGAPPLHFMPTTQWGKFQRIPLPTTGKQSSRWFPAPQLLDLKEPVKSLGERAGDLRVDTRGVALPLWLVLALYLVLWIGLLVWWRRRKARYRLLER